MNRIRFDQPADITLKNLHQKELIYVPFDLGLAMDIPAGAESPQDSATKQRFQSTVHQTEAAA